MREEIDVAIKRTLSIVLFSWRCIAVCMFAGAVLLNAFSILRQYNSNNQVMIEDDEMKDYENKLSERERMEVLAARDMYLILMDKYKKSQDYLKNSILMNIDPNKVCRYKVQYLVDVHYEVEYPLISERDDTSSVLSAYSFALTNNDVFEKIVNELGLEVEASDIAELVAVNSNYDLFSISIIGKDKELCEQIATIYKDEVNAMTPKLQETYGGFDIKILNESYTISRDNSVLENQISRINSSNSIKNSYNNLQQYLSDEQKKYYFSLLDKEFEMDLNEDISGEVSNIENKSIDYFHFKFVCIGAVLGGMLSVIFIIVFRVIFSRKARFESEIHDLDSIPSFETVVFKPKKRLFESVDIKLYERLYHGSTHFDDDLKALVGNLEFFLTNKNIRKIHLISTISKDETIVAVVNKLKAKLDSDICISYGTSPATDIESLIRASKSQGCIMIEEYGVSRTRDIEASKKCCNNNDIPIIGYIIINPVNI